MVDFECMISNIAATRGPQEDVELKNYNLDQFAF